MPSSWISHFVSFWIHRPARLWLRPAVTASRGEGNRAHTPRLCNHGRSVPAETNTQKVFPVTPAVFTCGVDDNDGRHFKVNQSQIRAVRVKAVPVDARETKSGANRCFWTHHGSVKKPRCVENVIRTGRVSGMFRGPLLGSYTGAPHCVTARLVIRGFS